MRTSTVTPVYIENTANTIGTVSARLPEDLEEELEAYLEDQRLDRSIAVRTLLAEGLDAWRTQRALNRLEAGEVSFSRAAELADQNIWDFARFVRERDITWVAEKGVDSDLEAL